MGMTYRELIGLSPDTIAMRAQRAEDAFEAQQYVPNADDVLCAAMSRPDLYDIKEGPNGEPLVKLR